MIHQLTLTNSTFQQWLCEIELKLGSKLVSYLISPIQRVPRYVLLLNELVTISDENSQDYTLVVQAKNMLEVIAGNINDYIKWGEHTKTILSVAKSIQKVPHEFSIIKASRTYIGGNKTHTRVAQLMFLD